MCDFGSSLRASARTFATDFLLVACHRCVVKGRHHRNVMSLRAAEFLVTLFRELIVFINVWLFRLELRRHRNASNWNLMVVWDTRACVQDFLGDDFKSQGSHVAYTGPEFSTQVRGAFHICSFPAENIILVWIVSGVAVWFRSGKGYGKSCSRVLCVRFFRLHRAGMALSMSPREVRELIRQTSWIRIRKVVINTAPLGMISSRRYEISPMVLFHFSRKSYGETPFRVE